MRSRKWLAALIVLLAACGPGQYTGTLDTPDGRHYQGSGSIAEVPNTPLPATATTVPLTSTSAPATATAAPPTAVPPTATPLPVEMFNGVPVCLDHDATVWHQLVKRDGAGNATCTYTHHHGDDPHLVDATFGAPGSWWNNGTEQDIAYPWVTSPAENALSPPYGTGKHNLFKILVRKDLIPRQQSWPNYFRSFRVTTHLLGSGGHIPGTTAMDGFQMQFHSYQAEMEICRDGATSYTGGAAVNPTCGTVRMGGTQDIGFGMLQDPNLTGEQDYCVLPNALWVPSDCTNSAAQGDAQRHMHGRSDSGRRDFTWYAVTSPSYRRLSTAPYSLGLSIGTLGQAWAPVDPMDFDALPFYDPDQFTAAWLSQEILAIYLDPGMPGWTGWDTNLVTYHGYADAYGNFYSSACGEPMAACIPVAIDGAPAAYTIHRDSAAGGGAVDHDVHTAAGKSLTRYPN